MGRFIFNEEIVPRDLGFVGKHSGNEEKLRWRGVNFHVSKKAWSQILEKVINVHGAVQTAETLDINIKAIGYKYSTRAAMTVPFPAI